MTLKLASFYRKKGQEKFPDFQMKPHYEMILIHSGKCRYLIGKHVYQVRSGDLLLLDGKTIQGAHIFSDTEDYERSIIQFDADWLLPLLQDLKVAYLLDAFAESRHGLIRIYTDEDTKRIEQSFLKIDRMSDFAPTYQNDALRKLAITELLLRIDLATVRVSEKIHVHKDEKIKIAEDVLTYIYDNYRDAITIEDIANGLDLSKSYISHIFKDVTGFSIMNYLMRYRLNASTNALLREHSKSIKVIAHENGFESDAHFSRFFKKNFGQTPNRFRKNYSM